MFRRRCKTTATTTHSVVSCDLKSVASDGGDSSSIQSSIKLRSCLMRPRHHDVDDATNSNRSWSSHSFSLASSSCRSSSIKSVFTGSSTPKKRVRFLNVQVRPFERVIGDNPSCSNGAPVSIGWAHGKDRIMRLDDYESARRPKRRSQMELVLSRQDRERILLDWGASFNEIIEAIRANIRAKNQRRRTVNNIGTYDRWEEAMESAGRRLKRTLLLRKPTRKKAEDLQARSERIASMFGESVTYVVDDDDAPVPPAQPTSDSCSESAEERSEPVLEEDLRSSSTTHAEERSEDSIQQLWPAAPLTEVNVDVTIDQQTFVSEDSSWMGSQQSPEDDDHVCYSDDGFEDLTRDNSFWEVDEGCSHPYIRRKMTPVIISEDGYYSEAANANDHQPPPWGSSDNGFKWMQPPPQSNLIISKWE